MSRLKKCHCLRSKFNKCWDKKVILLNYAIASVGVLKRTQQYNNLSKLLSWILAYALFFYLETYPDPVSVSHILTSGCHMDRTERERDSLVEI